MKNGQGKRGGFPRTRLSASQHVTPAEGVRNRLRLDRRGGGIGLGNQSSEDWLGQSQISKLHERSFSGEQFAHPKDPRQMPGKRSPVRYNWASESGKCRERGLREQSRRAVVYLTVYIGTTAIVHEFAA